MSKIAVCVNVPVPAGMTVADEIVLATVKLQGIMNSFSHGWPYTPITAFPAKDMLGGYYTRMQLTALRKTYNWEIGMSDPVSYQSISLYPYDVQLMKLTDCKNAVANVRLCRDPIQPVWSYMPQGAINQDTIEVLKAINISDAVADFEAEGIKILGPNCNNVVAAKAKVLAGEDVILKLDTDYLPSTNVPYGQEYIPGTKDLLAAAKSMGAVFVHAKDF